MPPSVPPDVATPVGRRGHAAFAVAGHTGAGPPLGRWLAILLTCLGVAIVKPWPATWTRVEEAADPVASGAERRSPAPPPASTGPLGTTPAATSICMDPPSWRLATVERWRDQTIRVWRAIEPISIAAGPDDDRVPITSLVTEGVIELGWCAPGGRWSRGDRRRGGRGLAADAGRDRAGRASPAGSRRRRRRRPGRSTTRRMHAGRSCGTMGRMSSSTAPPGDRRAGSRSSSQLRRRPGDPA